MLDASEYVMRVVRFCTLDMPTVPLREGNVLREIPQEEEDLEFGRNDLESVCIHGIYEKLD